MCSHVAHDSDVLPYLDLLLPDLRHVLLDAIPNVRCTAAQALGSLAAGLGEEGLPGLVDWLLAALTSADGAGPVLAAAEGDRCTGTRAAQLFPRIPEGLFHGLVVVSSSSACAQVAHGAPRGT